MTDQRHEAISRLKAWVRDFGYTKEPAFVRDIETLLAMVVSEDE